MRPAVAVSLRSLKSTRSLPMTVWMKLSHSGGAALHGGLDLALTLLVPAVAGAAARSVTFTCDRPAQPPSLTPVPLTTQTKPCAIAQRPLPRRRRNAAGAHDRPLRRHLATQAARDLPRARQLLRQRQLRHGADRRALPPHGLKPH